MRRKPLYISILFLILVAILFVVYKVNNINAFAIDTIVLPQIEKFDTKIYKIDKYKIWEMKNVYLYDGDYLFETERGDKKLLNRFYMVNKRIQDINEFANHFMEFKHLDFNENDEIHRKLRWGRLKHLDFNENDEILIDYYFYLESKQLPKYWKPVWNRLCIDQLTQHKDDLLFVITTDAHKNILNVDVPFLKK